jgi:hypothetical protein
MRIWNLLAVLGAVTSPALGQGGQLTRPDAWRIRPDQPGADTTALEFVAMPPGWHITTGPSLILWDPAKTAFGQYTVESEVFFFRGKSRDTEGYGILLGGKNLDGPEPDYVYFLLRNDGKYLVKHRVGSQTHVIQDWTAHAAVARHTGAGGPTVKNVIRVEAGADSVRFFVNDQAVAAFPRGHMRADGIVGLRVNHGLNLHVSKLEVK